MFDQAFFQDIRAIVDDLFVGSEKVYIERQLLYNEASDTMTAQDPEGAAVEAVAAQVSKSLVDGEKILKTDSSVLIPASKIAFEPKPGDAVRFGEASDSTPKYQILHVGTVRSVSTVILYEMVVRI